MDDGPDIWGKIIPAAAAAVILTLVVGCGASIIKPSEAEVQREINRTRSHECWTSGGTWMMHNKRCMPRDLYTPPKPYETLEADRLRREGKHRIESDRLRRDVIDENKNLTEAELEAREKCLWGTRGGSWDVHRRQCDTR